MLLRGRLTSFIALGTLFFVTIFTPATASSDISTQAYTWNNVRIGGGGGFVPGIVFNPSQKGLAYARTDIGGAYKLNPDDSWTPLLDFADNSRWDYWGTDALATDPVDPERLYLVSMFLSHVDIYFLTDVLLGSRNVYELLGPEQWHYSNFN